MRPVGLEDGVLKFDPCSVVSEQCSMSGRSQHWSLQEWWRRNPGSFPSDFKPVKGLNSGSDLSLLMVKGELLKSLLI